MAGIPIVGPGEHNHGPLSERDPNIAAKSPPKSSRKAVSKKKDSPKKDASTLGTIQAQNKVMGEVV